MKIVGNYDRYRGPECGTHTAHDFFVGLRISIGDHRAMQRKQNAVELRSSFQACDRVAASEFRMCPLSEAP